jgi:predicted histone-like DNA-binding protein
MALKLKKVQRVNPQDRTQSKWYFTQAKSGTVGMTEIAEDIAGFSALSPGDVQSVLSNLVDRIPVFLKLGQTVNLPGFGSFRVSVSTNGAETSEELTSHNVKGLKLLFTPSRALKGKLANMGYEIV